MKIKLRPEDFVVEELAALPAQPGQIAIYTLEKSGLTTLDAIAAVARAFDIPRKVVRHAGLKDRHAQTTQHLWIERGPERSIEEKGLALKFLRKSALPPEPRGNRFRIVLRDLDPVEATRLAGAAASVAADGVPNYFDSQRFGSARHGEGFVGKKVLLRNWEEALKLALAKPSEFDTESRQKRMGAFKRHWGQWESCVEKAGTRTEAHVFGYLARRRGDFSGALKLIERPLLAMYMHAYQSWLWNEAVGRFLRKSLTSDVLMAARYLGGYLWFHRFVPADLINRWRTMTIPLFAYRTHCTDPVVAEVYSEVLRAEKLEQMDFKPAGHNLPYLKGEERALLLFPEKLVAGEPEADEMHPGRKKASLAFELRRGGYATLVVKKLRLLISEGKEGDVGGVEIADE
ncbi:MAG: tRNA pseudouridine(13) synthase TruD [Planctomycetes bacterium]|nr:tRNA pseudouridine(13) synthase TruD [Planctomycetota bacterium]